MKQDLFTDTALYEPPEPPHPSDVLQVQAQVIVRGLWFSDLPDMLGIRP